MSCVSKLRLERQHLHRLIACAGLGLSLLAGCGGPERPEMGTVSGTITQGGEPLANAWIQFEPETGRTSAGRTDEEGHYTLFYTPGEPGAKAGTHTVSIGTGSEQRGNRSGMTRGEASQGRQQLFERSSVKVDAGENVIDFEITENNGYQPGADNPRQTRGRLRR